MRYILLTLFLLLSVTSTASARCTWEWDCTTGTCKQVPVCDSTLDLPPIKPLELPPLVLPPVKPLDPLVIPPIGTGRCGTEYLCNATGQCRWESVCR